MAKEYRSPGAGKGGGTQLEARRSLRGRPWWASGALALVILGLQVACATGYPMGRTLAGTARHWGRAQRERPGAEDRAGEARAVAVARPDVLSEGLAAGDADADAREDPAVAEASTTEGDEMARRPWRQARRPSKTDEQDELEGKGVGWRDGVGDGRPYEVPMTLDYFQGFLVQAGVPTTAVPANGRTLSPQQALDLVPHLLSTPLTLGNFGLRRMAAHLLLDVATGGEPVSRDELHARMRRFSRLLVLRPDGYLVKATSGVAVQKAG